MNTKFLVSIGTAIAASKIAKTITSLDADDLLGTVGLARRRSHFAESLALVGAGAVVGAGVALLFAPSSGREIRERIGSEANRLGETAMDAIRERKQDALRSISQVANGVSNSSLEHS